MTTCRHPHGYNAMGCCFLCGAKIAADISNDSGVIVYPLNQPQPIVNTITGTLVPWPAPVGLE
jgi:hypothetical protein